MIFDSLHGAHERIEDELGVGLSWERLSGKRASRIAYYYPERAAITMSDEDLEPITAWAVDTMPAFEATLRPYLKLIAAQQAMGDGD